MQSTNIPSKIPLPFANAAGSGYVNTIPTASQIGITNGRASLTDGFPPLTFTPIGSGGVPPFGADMNGILKEITAIQQWQEAGGFFPYDSAFSTTVGGYPKGAVLQSSSFNGLWISTAENNTTNPDTGGAGWISTAFEGLQSVALVSNTVTLTQLQSAYPIVTITGTLTANGTVNIPAQVGEWIFSNQTTGAFTLTVKTPSGTGVNITQGSSQYCWGDGTNIYYANASSVTSFNTRTGSITLNATDVVNALGFTPGNLIATRYFTANTTYTPTTGTAYIIVVVVGGGAGGGQPGNPNGGGGGGAGGFARKKITSGFSSVAITIGAGGAINSNGGTTSFGIILSATGGTTGGLGGGAGGTGTGGDVNYQGSGGSGGSTSYVASGSGGAGYLGFGGGNAAGGAGGTGTGGGGGGAYPTGSAGVGGSGIVVVYEYV